MKKLQIRRGWVRYMRLMPSRGQPDYTDRQIDSRNNDGQVKMTIDSILTIESDLLTVTVRGLFRGSIFRFAVAVRLATRFHAGPHEELFARDTAAPQKRNSKQQGKKRTGKCSAQDSVLSISVLRLERLWLLVDHRLTL